MKNFLLSFSCTFFIVTLFSAPLNIEGIVIPDDIERTETGILGCSDVTVTELGDITINCDEAIPDPIVPDFTDSEGMDLNITLTEDVNILPCGFEITRTYTATNDCGNFASTDRLITVIDVTAPIVVFTPADVTIQCDEAIPFEQPTFIDNCDGELIVTYTEITTGDECSLTLSRTWTATDICGNETSTTQRIIIIDTTAPITVYTPDDVTIECDNTIPYVEPTFVDNCTNDLIVTLTEVISGDNCSYVLTRTWTATDDCGNFVTTTNTITVVDSTAPSVIFAPEDLILECDEDIPFVEPIFIDNCTDFNVSLTETVSGDECSFIITRTWIATDFCGNFVSTINTITVEDTTAPAVVVAPEDLILECGEDIPFIELTFVDNCTDDIVVDLSVMESGFGCSSIITRTWIATDDCGNTVSETQIISYMETCASDFNGDGTTDGDDFAIFLGNFGLPCTGTPCDTDLNFDGVTNGNDFAEFLGNFGVDCN